MRLPCAAGGFYPAEKAALSKLIRECYSHRLGPKGAAKKILGGVAPHAGYVYSGPAAAWFFHHLKASNPGTVVIIGPNHTGYGTGVSASSDDVWATPLGNISVDIPLRAKIAELCDEVVVEPLAHKFEHSIEVQLPFLLEMNPQAKFVPSASQPPTRPSARNWGRRSPSSTSRYWPLLTSPITSRKKKRTSRITWSSKKYSPWTPMACSRSSPRTTSPCAAMRLSRRCCGP